MRNFFIILSTLVLVMPTSWSDCFYETQEYRSAVNSFNYSRSDAESEAKSYISCLNYASESEDCSSEMSRLQNSHDDLEYAVSTLQSAKSNYEYCNY